jgi:hypothetical protein
MDRGRAAWAQDKPHTLGHHGNSFRRRWIDLAAVSRMVKKLKRQEAWAVSAFGVASPPVVRYSFATIDSAHRGLDGRGRLMDLAHILA